MRRERLYVRDVAGVVSLVRETTEQDPGSTYPTLTFATAMNPRTRTVVQSGLDPVGVFSYLLGSSTTGVSSVATADLPSITAVEVRLSIDGDGPGGVKPTVLRSTVRPYSL